MTAERCCFCPNRATHVAKGLPLCDDCDELSHAQAATAKTQRPLARRKLSARRYAKKFLWPKREQP